MKLSLKELAAREEYLNKIIDDKSKLGEIDGNIRVIKHHNGYQYFFRKDKKEKSGSYIRKSDMDIAKNISQGQYDKAIYDRAKKELRHIAALKKLYSDGAVEDVYEGMHAGKQVLVEPIEIPDKEFLNSWYEKEYEKLEFRDDAPEFYTDTGIRVRSKSEVIIGNELERNGILYRYEKPLQLDGKAIVMHPDFTVLDMARRKEIYWEHFGMMDDLDYRNSMLMKIKNYELSGIYMGDRLIFTMETSKQPLDIRQLRAFIRRLKERLG